MVQKVLQICKIAASMVLLLNAVQGNNERYRRLEDIRETFYTRYGSYPEYCSTPDEMKTRAIPPLEDHQGSVFGETRLLHVTSIIRHGARTPWRGAPKYRCWDSYWTDVETAIWDCKLTTLMAPPLLETIEIEEGKQINNNDDEDRDLAFFLFEKKFDALRYPEAGLTNELNGTCQGKSTNISTACRDFGITDAL